MPGPRVAVLDYGIGNLRSAQKALVHAGADAVLTDDAATADSADAVVLPGVGAFGACMDALRSSGLEPCVRRAVDDGRPFLGICVGMQMLFGSSDEDPGHAGLGVIPGRVRWIPDGVPRPQMQWNNLSVRKDEPMFAGLGDSPWMYFVHSLHGVPDNPADVVATVRYGGEVNAAFRRDNVFAVQFHPEKSAAAGLRLLANFVASAA
ncbi:MAG: imidazole glycerol phosphate synthase subunit HisH [Actinomycetota bacterium]|jgi:glutamine amidotransferase